MKRLIYDAWPQHVLVVGKKEIHGGEEFTVSDEQAQALIDQGVPVRATQADLSKLKRDELDLLATQAGVKNPGDLSSKEAVIAAIEAQTNPTQPEADTQARGTTSQED